MDKKNNKQEISVYEDIIRLPHHVSEHHPQMSLADRAAQFSPFSALSGYEDAVAETARRTEKYVVLNDEEIEKLNRQIAWIRQHIAEKPQARITFFVPDKTKSGGAYVTKEVVVKKINIYEKTLIAEDGTVIPLENILTIEETANKTI